MPCALPWEGLPEAGPGQNEAGTPVPRRVRLSPQGAVIAFQLEEHKPCLTTPAPVTLRFCLYQF